MDETVTETKEHRLGDLSVHYYGPALEINHSLNARVLAPALLDLADAIEAAKSEVSPDSEIELRVEATEVGSFDLMMFLQAVGQFSTTAPGQGLAYLTAIGGVGFLTILIGAFKFVSNRFKQGEGTIEKKEPAEDDGTTFTDEKVTVKYPDGQTVTYFRTSIRIANNRRFVNSTGKALAGPSDQDGVDGAELAGAGELINVDQRTARTMADWTPEENIVRQTDTELTVQPLDAHFEPGKKWHVTVGGETKYTVDIEDEGFLQSIENGKRIGKKDIFVVMLHTVSSIGKDGKLKSRHTITKVRKHIPVEETEQGEFEFHE